jgi:hypothetical protein
VPIAKSGDPNSECVKSTPDRDQKITTIGRPEASPVSMPITSTRTRRRSVTSVSRR